MFESAEIAHGHSHAQNRFSVIPTHEKLDADPRYLGRAVTIAFLDSGFYPHPDFVARVVAFHDIAGEERSLRSIGEPRGHHWHGTQTVAACAGDGALSNGVYSGLARESRLILVKVSVNGRISDGSIEKGLRWIIENRAKYNIRVLNMSLGGDADLPASESCVDRLAEELVSAGVVVTVAAGNSTNSRPIPPANSPSVITVGGFSDENQPATESYELYHSSYGITADELVKPELIAPARYVAAPILPGSTDHSSAEILSMMASAPDYRIGRLLKELWFEAGVPESVLDLPVDAARAAIEAILKDRKIVATHYQHVDGTSFAAPIVASVAAQMLEANPDLTPATVKNILVSTASRLSGHPTICQGFGVVNARVAVEMAAAESHRLAPSNYYPPRIMDGRICFRYHDDTARSISLCGDFNGWRHDEHRLECNGEGFWRTSIPCQPAGRYRYKFLIDGKHWKEDPSHGLLEDDGLGGMNSVLTIV